MLIPEKYRKDEQIIRLTIEQIIKDFGSLLPELVLSGNNSTLFDELTTQISAALQQIGKSNRTGFQSLMYRVDIKERDFIKLSSGKKSFDELAEKIIQREFQKVLTRKYFSKKTD